MTDYGIVRAAAVAKGSTNSAAQSKDNESNFEPAENQMVGYFDRVTGGQAICRDGEQWGQQWMKV
jgi:hypothetical protein